MPEFTFDACMTVEAETKEAAADLILEHCMNADIALYLMECGTLHKNRQQPEGDAGE